MPNIYFQNMMNKDFVTFIEPSPAIISRADWWKKADKKINIDGKETATIRSCPAINDSINFGYILYHQIDVRISCRDGEVDWEIPKNPLITIENTVDYFIQSHDPRQLVSYKVPEGFSNIPLKWHPGFSIKTDPGYSLWITSPMHRPDLPFIMLDAIVDTDVFPVSDPFAFFIKNNFNGIISAGTPMMQVIPFKREDFTMEVSADFDKEQYLKNSFSLHKYFFNRYKKTFWKRKNFK